MTANKFPLVRTLSLPTCDDEASNECGAKSPISRYELAAAPWYVLPAGRPEAYDDQLPLSAVMSEKVGILRGRPGKAGPSATLRMRGIVYRRMRP